LPFRNDDVWVGMRLLAAHSREARNRYIGRDKPAFHVFLELPRPPPQIPGKCKHGAAQRLKVERRRIQRRHGRNEPGDCDQQGADGCLIVAKD
jgi:hypothetical protein